MEQGFTLERKPLEDTKVEKLILEDLATKVDRWIRREDTWLARGLAQISHHKVGEEYRNSPERKTADRVLGSFYAIGAIPSIGVVRIIQFVSNLKHPEDKGPFYYIQERVGKEGKQVEITKIRSMRNGADEDLKTVLENSSSYTPESDPRATKTGSLIRNIEADEFPQILQALDEENSGIALTDTRMLAQYAVDHIEEGRPETFEGWKKIYLTATPGLFNLHSAMSKDRKNDLKRYHYDMLWGRKANLGLHLFVHYRTWVRMVRKIEKKIKGTYTKSDA